LNGLPSILSKAQELFFQFGIKSITMDDLSKGMGISKKTIYKFVANKADLVNKTMSIHLENEKERITHISKESENAIDEMFQIGKHVVQHLRFLNPSVINDLRKYYPETWQNVMDYKNSFLYSIILNNINKGIKQGFYRKGINPEIISKIYSARSEVVIDQAIFPYSSYTFIEVYTEYLSYHIRGIATQEGLKYLEKQKLN